MTVLHLDYETKSAIDLMDRGLDIYATDPSTKVLLAGWALDDEEPAVWDKDDGERMPGDLKEALRDPDVTIWAFNAQFERWITNEVLGLDVPLERFRCSQVLSYMFSFTGGLAAVNDQMGAEEDRKKLADGKRLIRMFCGPNKTTKNQPFVWRDRHTDPEDWEAFVEYCRQDIVAERDIKQNLLKYRVPDEEWELYYLDQRINDRGLPADRTFIVNALEMANRRKAELISEMEPLTEVDNPNSRNQLLPWLWERGYPARDLQKDTISKLLKAEKESVKAGRPAAPILGNIRIDTYTVIKRGKETTESSPARISYDPVPSNATLDPVGRVVGSHFITQDCRDALVLRQSASKTSTTKYEAAIAGMADDDRIRHCFQFAGASRTNRWSGRKIQPQNLPRTPKYLEPEPHINFDRLDYTNHLIRTGDYAGLTLFTGEPMDSIAGCVRSLIHAHPGKKLVVCDLSSIESVVIGWLTGCERLLNVFREGRDAYRDFGTAMYKKPYDEITKGERSICKPAVLGAGYRLSGGEEEGDKKTGLWGYAENMGVEMSREEAHRSVTVFRETYKEIPKAWYALEDMIVKCLRTGRKTTFGDGKLEFEVKKPFLRVKLPSGRFMFYYKAKVNSYEFEGKYGPYTKWVISYMGIDQVTKQWTRIESHGGKFIENFVQAIARDLLAMGMTIADLYEFFLVGHVHDELISEEDEDDDVHSWQFLAECMTKKVQERYPWTRDIPLGAAGYEAVVYRKD